MKRKILLGAAGLVVLLLLVGIPFAIWALGSTEFPEPSGPHEVGTLELALVDSSRTEGLAETGGTREVGVRIWYPAAADAQGKRLPIMDGRLAKAFSDQTGAPFGDEDGPPSAAIIDATPLAEGEGLPVVLFSHGGFAHRDQNLSTMQELASQGFIVIGIGHTHEAILSLMPDGRSVAQDPQLTKGMNAFASGSAALVEEHNAAIDRMKAAGDRESAIAAARDLGRVMTKMLEPLGHTPEELIEIRAGDIAFVLAQLRELDANPEHPLHGRYDLDRVGIFGHSMGAHTSLSACLDPSIEVLACASLDTAYYILNDRPLPTLERPLLVAYAGAAEFALAGSNDFLLRDATASAGSVSVSIDGATHMNFTDMNFMPRFLRLVGVLGPIDGGRAATINDDLIVSFFRRHLKGEAQPWLDAPGERYEELR